MAAFVTALENLYFLKNVVGTAMELREPKDD